MFLVAQWLVFPKMLQLQSNFGSKCLLGVLMLSYAAIHTPTLRMNLLVVPFTTYYSVLDRSTLLIYYLQYLNKTHKDQSKLQKGEREKRICPS